jgi:tetratricopeptide (TPR) repeat protein
MRVFFQRCIVFLLLPWCGLFVSIPWHATAQSSGKIEEHVARGEMLFSQGNWDGAVKELRAAARLDPHRADIRANLGMAYYFKNDLSAAVTEFQTALRMDPERMDAAYGLGLTLYETGDLPGAIAAFQTAARLNPTAYFNLGNTLEQHGDGANALEAYRGYIAAAPQTPEAAVLREAVQAGNIPTPVAGTAREHFLRGQALLEKKDAGAAAIEFLMALRLKPNYAEASNGLGLAFRLNGELAEAIAGYKMAIRLDPRFGPAHRNLAQAFEEQGDRAQAAQAYDRYLLLVPGAADAAEVREKIAQLRKGG